MREGAFEKSYAPSDVLLTNQKEELFALIGRFDDAPFYEEHFRTHTLTRVALRRQRAKFFRLATITTNNRFLVHNNRLWRGADVSCLVCPYLNLFFTERLWLYQNCVSIIYLKSFELGVCFVNKPNNI